MFSHLIGNSLAKHLLAKMLQEQKVPFTLLFSGREGVGKSHFAKAFAKKLLGEGYKSDCMLLQPEEKSALHSIEAVRHMIKEAALPPLESSKRVFLIDDADKMLPASSNALLKTLEEPPSHSLFILIASDVSALLPTIVSRSRRIDFLPIPTQELTEHLCKSCNQPLDEAKKIAERSAGSVALAKELCAKAYDPLINHFREWRENKDGKILDKIEELVSTEPQADFLFGLMIEELQAKSAWNETSAKLILEGRLAWQRRIKIKTILNWMQLQ